MPLRVPIGSERTINDENRSGAVEPLHKTGVKDAAVESSYKADAENRSRNRHRKHGDEFHKSLAGEFSLYDQVGDYHRNECGDGRCDERKPNRIEEYFVSVIFKNILIPFERQAVVPSPNLKERAEYDEDIKHDNEQRNDDTDRDERNAYAFVFYAHALPIPARADIFRR